MMGCGAEAAKMKGKRALQGWPSNPSLPKRLTSGQKLEEVAAAASVTIPDEIGTALDGDSQSQEVPCAIGLETCQPAPCRGTSPQRLSEEELAAAATEHIAPASFGSAGEASSGCGDISIKSLDDVVLKLSSDCDESTAALRNAVQTLQTGGQAEIRKLCKPWGVRLGEQKDNGKYCPRACNVLKSELENTLIEEAKKHFRAKGQGSISSKRLTFLKVTRRCHVT